MSNEIETSVRQDTYETNGEGAAGRIRLNRRGELVTVDLYDQLVSDGRVFIGSNVARETAAAMGTASATFDDTDPALLLDVPTGTTAIPLEIIMNQAGTVAGGNTMVLITLSDKLRYTSGGVAIPRQNMRFDEPRTSNCPFYEGTTDIVAIANTDDITLWGNMLVHDVDGLYGSNVDWSARKFLAPRLVGPASMVIYAYAASTQPSYLFSIKWAELDTTDVI